MHYMAQRIMDRFDGSQRYLLIGFFYSGVLTTYIILKHQPLTWQS
jgi:hypothetical protein